MEEGQNIVYQQQKKLLVISIREMVNCNINKASIHLVDRKKTFNRIVVSSIKHNNLCKLAENLLDSALVILYEYSYEITIYRVENEEFVCKKFKDLDFYYAILDCMSDFQSMNDLITVTGWNSILEMNINLKKHNESVIGIIMGIKSADKKLKKKVTYKLEDRQKIAGILGKVDTTIGLILKDMINDLHDIIFWDIDHTIAITTSSDRIMAFDIKQDAYTKLRKLLYKEIAEGFQYGQ